MLFAAGGVFWESVSLRWRYVRPIVYAYAVLIAVAGMIFLPIAVPILPPETFLAYQKMVGIEPPKTEVEFGGPMPQHFGDRFGWEEMTEKVAGVYNSLPADERQRAAIFANNYGQAAAIDLFGKRYGLPRSISGHQSYFLWGPRDYDGSVIIILGGKKENAEKNCKDVEERDQVTHPYTMPYEHYNILICRGLLEPMSERWPKVKVWR